jgi:hypothetical protein
VLRNYSAMMAKQGKTREAQALQAGADALMPATKTGVARCLRLWW